MSAVEARTQAINQLKAVLVAAHPALRQERAGPIDVVGFGPDTAVTLLITLEDNPERLGSEPSFAALCGVSPVERSSGRRSSVASTVAATGRPTPRCIASC
ncbi:transposase [Streptomyces sp. NPDC090073]|uniref:transposase n=1 Tax=Streptomyces sp. NPDC090073 TaxID=3365936 RepID=UPI0038288EC1